MTQGQFKTYQRGRRQYTVDTLFTNGMMYTSGAVDSGYVKTLVNYDIQKEGDNLVPRSGLRVSELVLPDIAHETSAEYIEYHTNTDITLMASKDCIEKGRAYKQYILGRPANNEDELGRVWVSTSPTPELNVSDHEDEDTEYSIDLSIGKADYVGAPCSYLTTPLTSIHHMNMTAESKVASIVGTFAYNNGFYFMNPESGLCYTEMQDGADKYTIADVRPKAIDPSEAVTFGYNMLAGNDAYAFVNESTQGVIQLTGILPYSTKEENTLLMTPHHNEEIYLRCYFKGQIGKSYKFVWEWRNVGDEDWNTLQSLKDSPTYTVQASEDGQSVKLYNGSELLDNLEVVFKAPTENVLVRVQAYSTADTSTVEKAMTVGFDFSINSYGETNNIKQEVYDLTTATGMEFWNNRLVLWGIEKDPTILFISDVNDPSYFPYPNNISIYDEPIVCVKTYLNSLLVFTANSVHQVTLSGDGVSWNTTLVQSNLSIGPWDRHLIQVVRNMAFFKSGDYYYMLVPKAQSSTGKLALAPVSNTIIEFFNHFEKNVSQLLADTFDYVGSFDLVNYFNYLDYEDIHNIYVLRCEDDEGKYYYLHLGVLYNINTRSWRIHTYEAPHYLYPYRQDATKRGVLASTSLLNTVLDDGSSVIITDTFRATGVIDKTNYLDITDSFTDFYIVTGVRVEAKNYYGETYLNTTLTENVLDAVNNNMIYRNSSGYECGYCLVPGGIELYLKSASNDLWYGSEITIYDNATGDAIFGPTVVKTPARSIYTYEFTSGQITDGSNIEVLGERHILEYDAADACYRPTESDAFYIKDNAVYYKESHETGPIISVFNITDDTSQMLNTGRCIQLYKYDSLNLRDMYLPEYTLFKYSVDTASQQIAYDTEYIRDRIKEEIGTVYEKYMFRNWQYLDTGYRNDVLERNKRYRELQIQLNNLEGANLEFGLEFQIDGQSRLSYYVYETEHIVDVNDPNYGLLYVQATPYMNLPLEYVSTPNETVLGDGVNSWILNQSLFPELSLWKVRAPVSGKGIAPRMRLVSRNTSRFELMSINWIYRLMNAR